MEGGKGEKVQEAVLSALHHAWGETKGERG